MNFVSFSDQMRDFDNEFAYFMKQRFLSLLTEIDGLKKVHHKGKFDCFYQNKMGLKAFEKHNNIIEYFKQAHSSFSYNETSTTHNHKNTYLMHKLLSFLSDWNGFRQIFKLIDRFSRL